MLHRLMVGEWWDGLVGVFDTSSVVPDPVAYMPLPDGGVDRARTDRVLQHVRDPATAIGQVRRVLRPGGLFGMAEPDWETLAVADEDVDTSRRFARFLASRVRNAGLPCDRRSLTPATGFAADVAAARPL